MLNHVKPVAYGFPLFPRLFCFVFVGKPAFLALFFGLLFFGAGNSENCLNQFLSNYVVREVGSIRIHFLFLNSKPVLPEFRA